MSYKIQGVTNTGVVVDDGADTLQDAINAFNLISGTGQFQGIAVFNGDGDTVLSYGEGPALVYDKG